MSNQKFTDWRVMRKGGRIEINMGGSSIALADTPEDLGIAVFIAAAPEMYALLQKIVEIAGEAAETGYTTVTGDRILEQGKAILQKARGEK